MQLSVPVAGCCAGMGPGHREFGHVLIVGRGGSWTAVGLLGQLLCSYRYCSTQCLCKVAWGHEGGEKAWVCSMA